jgi:putative peptide zinc metalloprotease protein
MLCRVCHRWVSPRDGRCRGCGAVGRGRREVDLVLPDGERVPVERTLTLGRGPGNDLRLDDPTVSREHAQIELIDGCAFLSDRGSRFGTLLDGRRVQAPTELRAGMQITLGDLGLAVHGAGEAPAMTLSVPAGMSVILEGGAPRRVATAPGATRPRLRSGWSLKRLDAGPGYVLKDHRSSTFHRLDATDGTLVTLLDGQHDVRELVAEATKRAGDEGPARLARLLAELADRGLLADVPDRGQDSRTRAGWLRAALTPRELALPRAGAAVTAIYRRGGYLLFTRAGLAALAATALMGLGAFVALIAAGSDTPLVVNHRLGLGALAFLLARLVIVLAHELAHGLAAESAGRGVVRAGLKWVLVFPYAFVDVSDAWFDTVGRRIAIALAGPGSDLVLGGACALACALMAPGTGREVLFQAALAGYLGALFNLNPLLERDGYHVLADVLGEPGLRRRAALRTRAILAGRVTRADSEPVLWRYGLATLCWSALTVALAIAMSLRYYHRLVSVAPRAVVWTLLAAFYLVLALPLAFSVLAPLRQRRTGPQVIGDG